MSNSLQCFPLGKTFEDLIFIFNPLVIRHFILLTLHLVTVSGFTNLHMNSSNFVGYQYYYYFMSLFHNFKSMSLVIQKTCFMYFIFDFICFVTKHHLKR